MSDLKFDFPDSFYTIIIIQEKIMNEKTKAFIEDYRKTLDSEFDLFNAQASQHHYEHSGKAQPLETKRLSEIVQREEARFQAHRDNLVSYDLTPAEAKAVISHNQKDQFFGVDDINGADAYRFMSHEIKSNKEVALAAVKEDPNTARHLPPALKERVQGKNPEVILNNMINMDKLKEKMAPKQSQSVKMSFAM